MISYATSRVRFGSLSRGVRTQHDETGRERDTSGRAQRIGETLASDGASGGVALSS